MNDISGHAYATPAWSPYLVGALIGLLAVATLALAKHKVAASSAYAGIAGMVERLIAPSHVASLDYFCSNKPALGWSIVFLLCTGLGSFVAASTGGELTGTYLPQLWTARFGADRYAVRTSPQPVKGTSTHWSALWDYFSAPTSSRWSHGDASCRRSAS